MTTTQRKMLFILIVGIAAGICAFAFQSFIDAEALSLIIEIFYIIYCCISVFRIFSASTSLLRSLWLLLPLWAISPKRVYDYATIFSSTSFTYTFMVMYACFGFALIAPIIEYAISRREESRKTPAEYANELCRYCNHPIMGQNVFCPNCHKLSAELRDYINNNPHLHHTDYLLNNERGHFRCPSCSKSYGASYTFYIGNNLGSPIRRCKCGFFFIDQTMTEWSIAKASRKIGYCIFGGLFKLILMILSLYLVITLLSGRYILCAAALLVSAVLLRIIWLRLIAVSDFRLSQSRLLENPDYPNILTHMGYEHLDNRYQNTNNNSR